MDRSPSGSSFPTATRRRRTALGLAAWLSLLLGAASLSGSTTAAGSLATLSLETVATYNALPLTGSGGAPAIVMLGLSVDEQLHRRAYDNLSDLDGDGLIDNGYRDSLDYLGYFDPRLCYRYAGERYKAAARAGGAHGHHCQGDWSGNFLNWASMSRLDLLRWSLYGGRRSVDGAASTVLERSHLPPDSHAWAAFHDGRDISLYTPFADDPANPGLSLCNVSYSGDGDAESATSTAAPLLRVTRGLHRLWAASEERQCLWREESGSSDQPLRAQDYQLRVEVCDASAAAELQEAYCRRYPNGLKPAGVLQQYGESGQMLFGLLSGSHAKPRSGGQLRRNATKLAGNGAIACAAGDEIDLGSGQFCITAAGAPGIVNSLDRLRLARYRSQSGAPGHTDCSPGTVNRSSSPPALLSPGAGNQGCNSWGNPVAELQAEILRYLSGETTPTTSFIGDDSSFIAGLPRATWKDAWAQTEHCADCNVLLLSASANSFDSDELPAVPALGGDVAAAATRLIGSHESSGGQPLSAASLIGRVGATPTDALLPTSADRCTVKTVGDLALARGICPSAAALEGSYLVAGLAYRAWTGDLRPGPSSDGKSQGQQRARSHAIEFGSAVPSIPIRTSSGTLVLTPACEANPEADPTTSSGVWHSCAPGDAQLTSLRSHQPRGEVSPALLPYLHGRELDADGRAGSLLVAWDVSTYGGDQDRDLLQMISWCVGSRCLLDQNLPAGPDICWRSAATALCSADGQLLRGIGEDEVLVRVELLAAAGPEAARLGYVIAGASHDNGIRTPIQRAGGDDDSLIDGSAEPALSSAAPLGPAGHWSRPEIRSVVPGQGDGRQLETPLQLAAKYGGFDYPDGAASPLPTASTGLRPCLDSSWDHLDNASGRPGADCLPDQHHALANPGQLKQRLSQTLDGIRRRSGVAAEAAVLSGSTLGPGAIYQSAYRASVSDRSGRKVQWIGDLQALFVDRQGRLREDGNGNAQLDEDYSAAGDPVIEFERDGSQRPRFRRYTADPVVDPAAFTLIDDPESLRTIWRASRQLSAISDPAAQRDYSASAASGRHLFTFMDVNLDGKAQAGEQRAFVPATFGAGSQGLLNVAGTADAERLVRYTRGSDFAELRSRSVDLDGDGQPETMRLGDIVNSAPIAVAAPAEAYDLIYGDRSYAEFFGRYRNRRTVIYAGANDGLLHAFNGGFHEASRQRFGTAPADGSRVTEHPLGSELWAYVPFNLLPQLGWLADPRYGHLWTLDGSPRAFDARVFAADSDHPNGWGTLLVVGMRLGGGPVTIPDVGSSGANRAAVSAFAAGLGNRRSLVTRSAYVILDISNPELPPKLIAEFTDAEGRLGYSTSAPAIAAFGSRNASPSGSRSDRWLLFFGNGPDDLASATSVGNGRLFALDLGSLIAAANSSQPAAAALIGGAPIDFGSSAAAGAPASFIGDPVVADWDLDFLADALYVGSSGGTAANPIGRLFKLAFNESATAGNWAAPAVLLDVGRPVLAAPSVTQDRDGRRWLLSGSGRLLASGDRSSSAGQVLFGVIDGLPTTPAPSFATLVDTGSAVVQPSGMVSGVTNTSTELSLLAATVNAGGWRHALATAAGTAAERSISGTALVDGLLFATTYTPSISLCSGDGSSRLYGVDFRTGAPRARLPAFGLTRVIVNNAEVDAAVGVLDLGSGLALRPSLQVDTSAAGSIGVLKLSVASSRGAILQDKVTVSSAVRSGEIDWRQMRGRR